MLHAAVPTAAETTRPHGRAGAPSAGRYLEYAAGYGKNILGAYPVFMASVNGNNPAGRYPALQG